MRVQSLRILNFVFSFLVGIVSGFASRKYTKYYKIICVIMMILSYIVNWKLLKDDQNDN